VEKENEDEIAEEDPNQGKVKEIREVPWYMLHPDKSKLVLIFQALCDFLAIPVSIVYLWIIAFGFETRYN
jgi:hypothetical protein